MSVLYDKKLQPLKLFSLLTHNEVWSGSPAKMDSIPSRSMHMKHEVFVWTDCSTWNESVARASDPSLWYFFVFLTIHSKHKSKPIRGNCLPQWVLKKTACLEMWVECFCVFIHLALLHFLFCALPHTIHRNEMGRQTATGDDGVILVVTVEREIIYVCCWFSLHSFILFCMVICHQTSGPSELCCGTVPVSEFLTRRNLGLGKNVSDFGRSFA